ncbi:hypothetical protein [Brevibacterium litoralis]
MTTSPGWQLTEREKREAEELHKRVARELEEERRRRDAYLAKHRPIKRT